MAIVQEQSEYLSVVLAFSQDAKPLAFCLLPPLTLQRDRKRWQLLDELIAESEELGFYE
ncbi:hypothetical protein [Nostoc piscinale]|uniref:hypothetical protein n=1 Tax=Nostoc piscinale TaxID=224012 RepID=UPI00130D5E89|nr:hypothetical protein [Nostoc piscinale]